MVSDIPAGDGKTANLFLQCRVSATGIEAQLEDCSRLRAGALLEWKGYRRLGWLEGRASKERRGNSKKRTPGAVVIRQGRCDEMKGLEQSKDMVNKKLVPARCMYKSGIF